MLGEMQLSEPRISWFLHSGREGCWGAGGRSVCLLTSAVSAHPSVSSHLCGGSFRPAPWSPVAPRRVQAFCQEHSA